MKRFDLRDERGVTIVMYAVLLPAMLILTAVAWDAGNWWIHRKHLQTKVDASALAGGGVWSIPCGSDRDTNADGTGIIDVARRYVGVHTQASGSLYTATTFNPQVGGTNETKIHVVLNGTTWWDDDLGASPADKSGQPNPADSVCNSMFLDVKGTEGNNDPLFGIVPLTPDLKRKARVEIRQLVTLRGLLPIAVRVPKPLSAAAVFFDENSRNVLRVRYLREVCKEPAYTECDADIPAGLGQWKTADSSGGNGADISVGSETGVVIATSFRPACATGTVPAGVVTGSGACMEDAGFDGTPVNDFCRQLSAGVRPVRCEFATGSAGTQNVESGLQFIRGYSTTPVGGNPSGTGPPELRSVWLDGASGCGFPVRQAYFASESANCAAALHVNVAVGSYDPPGPTGETRTAANVQVRYKLVRGQTSGAGVAPCDDFGAGCDLSDSGTSNISASGPVTFASGTARNAFAIQVRMINTTINPGPPANDDIVCGTNISASNNPCIWYFTAQGRSGNANWANDANTFANPLQRSFMGNVNLSASVKWLRLLADTDCNGVPNYGLGETGEAASVVTPGGCSGGATRFFVQMGLQGGLARDQDEPPIQLNIGATSQSSVVDCDEDISNLKDEIVQGCQNPEYAANNFDTTPLCPDTNQFFDSPKSAPFNPPDNYPPWRCVLTQTSNSANQVMQGLNERFFGDPNNPTCPPDPGPDTVPGPPHPWTKGRNYWHNANNQDDHHTFADDRNTASTTDDLGNRLKAVNEDPRHVTLFFTSYDSFTGSGNETFPIVGLGNFYITGYGRLNGSGGWQGGSPTEPCNDGNGDPSPGAGSKPPPDLDMAAAPGVVIWGHFLKAVLPTTQGGQTSNVLCQPSQFQPCRPVLVE